MDAREDIESELRPPLWPVLMAVLFVGLMIALLQDFVPESDWLHTVILSTALCLLAAASWWINRWKPQAASWAVVIAWAVLAYVAHTYFPSVGLLALIAISPVLALPLIGLSAALVSAAVESLALIVLLCSGVGELTPQTVLVVVLVIWAVLGAESAVYWPTQQMLVWYVEYFSREKRNLEQARGHQAALGESLANLEYANYQLAQASERIAALRSVAEEARKAKALFVARVSHELRTPLNMIVGLVELMVDSPEIYTIDLPPQMEKDLDVVLSNCRHLSSMVDDVLDLTRMEEGRVMLRREWVDLADLAREAAAAVQPLVEKKGLTLEVQASENLPELHCDRTRIRQVLLNLVSNAARFTERGGITIALRAQHPYVVASVTDTGPGISQQDAQEIFQPFSQGAGDVWRDEGGSGLGLAISQQFIRLHQGRLWLESEMGVGSSFIFELPISQRAPHDVRPGHQIRGDWIWREDRFESARVAMPVQDRKPNIVVWDETQGLLPVLARYADEIGLVAARSLPEACEKVEALPDGVLMINTAVAGGLPAYLDKAGVLSPNTPAIGSSLPAYDARAVLYGAASYLTKPVSRKDLEIALRSVGTTVSRVLVVDDDPDVLSLLKRMLKVCDKELVVETANSGEQALKKLQGGSVDVMLLDIVMPGMNGWQVLDRVRDGGHYGNPAVFIVSAQDPLDAQEMVTPLAVTIGHGLSVKRFLACVGELSSILLTPEPELDPVPPRIDAERSAW